MIYESIINRRTIRKFTQQPVPREILRKCVDAARLSPSALNRQPLKYLIVTDQTRRSAVFSTLAWASHIPSFKHAPDEVPTAYIVILLDTTIRNQAINDPGIAAMSISLVAYEAGLGSCILGSADRPRLKDLLDIPDHLETRLVVALGYPRETSKAVESQDNHTQYWYDEYGVLNVSKRRLEKIIIDDTK